MHFLLGYTKKVIIESDGKFKEECNKTDLFSNFHLKRLCVSINNRQTIKLKEIKFVFSLFEGDCDFAAEL